jgi:hypothetical protein
MVTRLLDEQHIQRRPPLRKERGRVSGSRTDGSRTARRRKRVHSGPVARRPPTPISAENFRTRLVTSIRVAVLTAAIAGLITGLVMVGGEVASAAALAAPVVGDEFDRASVGMGGPYVTAAYAADEVEFERTEDTEYVITEGETLSEIADRFNLGYDLLAGYNEIADPDSVSPGQRILVPGVDELADLGESDFGPASSATSL